MNTTENHTDDYDSPWKEGIELYFKELMELEGIEHYLE